jgi:hypothetical protein
MDTTPHRPIPEFPGYYAFADGRIWSGRKSRFLAPQVSGEPRYRHVSVYDENGIQKTRLVHRLHMSAVHGRELSRAEVVEHINHDGSDNRWENLRVTTQKENIARGHRDGRQSVGERVGTSKLKEGEVRQIRVLYKAGCSQRKLAAMFKVSKTMVGHIVHRRFWQHVSD